MQKYFLLSANGQGEEQILSLTDFGTVLDALKHENVFFRH